tara:strand:- start:1676 stop:5086 length:3411 start_codon:yes stop_codon:yes gene_type:complete
MIHFKDLNLNSKLESIQLPLASSTDAQIPHLSGLDSSAKALVISRYFYQHGENILVVAENLSEFELLRSDLETMIDDAQFFLFSSTGLLPWELAKPENNASIERFRSVEYLEKSNNSKSKNSTSQPKQPIVLLTHTVALMEVIAPAEWSVGMQSFRVGKDYPFEDIRYELESLGYKEESQVENMGEFSIRASIVDVFPYQSKSPYRLDFFDETLEFIHTFDLFTQRTVKKAAVKSIKMGRCGEWVIPENANFLGAPEHKLEVQRIRFDGLDHEAFIWMRSWFYDSTDSLLDRFKGVCFISKEFSLRERVDKQWLKIKERRAHLENSYLYPMANKIWLDFESLHQKISQFKRIDLSGVSLGGKYSYNLDIQERGHGKIEDYEALIEELTQKDYEIYLVSQTESQSDRLQSLVEHWNIADFVVGHLHSGFIWHDFKIAFLTDHQIFNRMSRRRTGRRFQSGVSIPSFDQLKKGDYVIHQDYGVGRFVGTQRIQHGVDVHDCLILEYRGKDRLSLPVLDLSKLEKMMSSEANSPKLHSISGKVWEKTKEKAKKSAVKIAQELVQLYAKRQFVEGFPFPLDTKLQMEFENSFEYSPTVDQISATQAIKDDMQRVAPMDRLICGDVGFGKTEVAMRAAFKAINADKQVAILVPTTILASQHFQNFLERFSSWPVRIELLNRFRSAKEKKLVIEDLKLGKVDIVVGTHSLLSEKIRFQDLGLYIIDEEQKFGVKQKEKLREARLEVDTLSMSATPIPRTLHLSLSGVRDISLITTPPMNRLPIETRVQKFSPEHLADGIRYELERGGQSFVVNDHIRELGFLADHIEASVPEARVAIAHGQMNEKDLEQVMAAFVNHEYDVLVSTTIVENGIDISSANSMFIYNAHRFGISQLYQLRGRVGRGDVQGYARFFIPSEQEISADSKKRLEALETHTDLGSGYQLAMRDLEVRGSGNLLGAEQHGHISEIGIETYIKMVQQSVKELQGQELIPDIEPELNIPVESFIPESYIEDGMVRLSVYQRLSRLVQVRDFVDLKAELIERFGELPRAVDQLVQMMILRQLCKQLGFKVVDLLSSGHCKVTPVSEIMQKKDFLEGFLEKSPRPWRILYQEPLQIQFELRESGYILQLREIVSMFMEMKGFNL